MNINQAGLELIKSYEGLRLHAYKCPAGVWTIGYGHTGSVQPGQQISLPRAEQLLRQDLTRFENAVKNALKVPVNQNQFSALVSFTFNIGIGAFLKSTLLRKLNQGDYLGAAVEFSRWVYANNVKLEGLVKRRNAERILFLKPV